MKGFKRVFCVLLSLLLLGTLFPATVFAADAPQIYVAGVGMNDGHYLAQGADEVSTEQPEDRYAYYMDGVLTLHNFSYSGCGTPWDVASYAGIYAPTAVTIRLEGSNSIQAVGQAFFSHKDLDHKSQNDIRAMLKEQKDVDWWENYTPCEKFGSCVTKTRKETIGEDSFRMKWEHDLEIPLFSKDRNYIDQFVFIGEE